MSRLPVLIAAGAALALPAGASAAPGPLLHPEAAGPRASVARVKLPEVKRISPRRVAINHVLTIRGRNFVPGKAKNTVVFQRSGGRYVFVRAGGSSSTLMRVLIPKKLATFLALRKGISQPTRFRIRVLARRFGAAFSSVSRSPVVTPSGGGLTGSTNACGPESANASPAADADKDGLTNALEKKIHTDPCLADTDGDGLSDLWEYKSALDYNSTGSPADAVPYPGKRPYPNPLDPSDKNIDFDGDGLTAFEENEIWVKCGTKDFSKPLFESDGTQSSARPTFISPSSPQAGLDLNGNGVLTDDERDSDLCDPTGLKGDGLGNWTEASGPMQPAWWTKIVEGEKPYGLSRFAGTDFLDPDTDGDGIKDGRDDVDHDGYENADEVNRYVLQPGEFGRYNLAIGTGALWIQPFNPCLPDPHSPTCSIHHPPPTESWPPFDRSYGSASVPLQMDDTAISPAPEGN